MRHKYEIDASNAHLASEGNVNFSNTTGGHSGRGVEPAEFLDKGLREGWVGLEVLELVGVLQKSDDSLKKTENDRVRDSSPGKH